MKKVKKLLHHYLLPHEKNNYRAKLLHHTSILFIIGLFFLASLFTSSLKTHFPQVLGVSTDITSDQLLQMTNEKRQENGLAPLVLDTALTNAAKAKAADMLAKDYWAHNAPDGTTPWIFIKNAGYQYLYAGENLARGFTDSKSAIDAWMASPDHRANMLSKNYSDVGFAVISGKLTGEDTVLIVEELGSTETLTGKETAIQQPIVYETAPAKGIQQVQSASSLPAKPLINASSFSSYIVTIILGLFIFVLLIDMIIIEKKKVVRFVGHNPDHIFYLLSIILSILIVFGKGIIL